MTIDPTSNSLTNDNAFHPMMQLSMSIPIDAHTQVRYNCVKTEEGILQCFENVRNVSAKQNKELCRTLHPLEVPRFQEKIFRKMQEQVDGLYELHHEIQRTEYSSTREFVSGLFGNRKKAALIKEAKESIGDLYKRLAFICLTYRSDDSAQVHFSSLYESVVADLIELATLRPAFWENSPQDDRRLSFAHPTELPALIASTEFATRLAQAQDKYAELKNLFGLANESLLLTAFTFEVSLTARAVLFAVHSPAGQSLIKRALYWSRDMVLATGSFQQRPQLQDSSVAEQKNVSTHSMKELRKVQVEGIFQKFFQDDFKDLRDAQSMEEIQMLMEHYKRQFLRVKKLYEDKVSQPRALKERYDTFLSAIEEILVAKSTKFKQEFLLSREILALSEVSIGDDLAEGIREHGKSWNESLKGAPFTALLVGRKVAVGVAGGGRTILSATTHALGDVLFRQGVQAGAVRVLEFGKAQAQRVGGIALQNILEEQDSDEEEPPAIQSSEPSAIEN